MNSENQGVKYLVFDIETVVDGRLVQRTRYPDEPEMTPAEAIQRYQEELREASNGQSEFVPYTYAVPVSIAIAKVDAAFNLLEVRTLDRDRFRPQVITRHFWDGWQKYNCPILVTFNGRTFDLPVMELAAFRYGIAAPKWFNFTGAAYSQCRYRYSFEHHFDIMEFLGNFGSTRMTGGLDLLACLLNKPGKLDTRGSMVQELYEQGEHVRIDDYCVCDVLDTYFVFLRCQVLLGTLTLESERERVLAAKAWIEKSVDTYGGLKKYLDQFRLWEDPGPEGSPFVQ